MRVIPGLAAMSYGALLVAIIWTSMAIFLIDRRFVQATLWAIVACVLSGLGLIHQSEADLTFKKLGKKKHVPPPFRTSNFLGIQIKSPGVYSIGTTKV